MLYMVTNNKMYSGVYKNLKNKIFQLTQAKVNILLELILAVMYFADINSECKNNFTTNRGKVHTGN